MKCPSARPHVERLGKNGKFDVAFLGCDIQHDFALRLVEATALRRETKMPDFKDGNRVFRVERVSISGKRDAAAEKRGHARDYDFIHGILQLTG
jgi:hypothetical protein